MSILAVESLVKTYPGSRKSPPVEAVRGVSFTVERGEFFGLLGPNGAGKSTTIGCISTLVRPSSGRILVDGVDVSKQPQEAKRRIAVVPQTRNLDRDLSVREVLTYHGRYFGLPAAERESRADRLCQRLAIIDHGKILTLDTPAALKKSLPGAQVLDLWVRAPQPLAPRLREISPHRAGAARMTAFLALLRRDLVVASRNAVLLIFSTLTQPILVILVFGNILPRLGLVSANFGTVMVPGLMAIAILMAGVQGVLIPFVQDLSGSREVEERLLAPIGALGVSAGRIVAGAVHAAAAGLVAGPAMILLMHGVGLGDVRPHWPLLLPLVVVCGLLSAAFGLTLGTRVQPRFSGLLFGCAYYPWAQLSAIGPVRYLFLLNPLTFVSEAMRLAVTPEVPHMEVPLLLLGLFGYLALCTLLGARSFEKRTIL